MSYDVDVLDEDFNYTSNMREFFIAFGVYPPHWDGLHRADVAERIRNALERIEQVNEADLAAKYDAPNGWGKVENAVPWLRAVLAACEKPLSEIVRVSA